MKILESAPFPYSVSAQQIPAEKVVRASSLRSETVEVRYRCPDSCWRQHLAAWSNAWAAGRRDAPQPVPFGHLIFDNPVAYGFIRFGETDEAVIRYAVECELRGTLGDWRQGVPEERLSQIIEAASRAIMAGTDIGSLPFVACLNLSR